MVDLIDTRAYKEKNDGYSWIVTMIDSFSKFAMIGISKSKTSKEISRIIKKKFCFYGPPVILHSDNGTEFKNKDLEKICKTFGVKQVFGRPRAPWVQGQVLFFINIIKDRTV